MPSTQLVHLPSIVSDRQLGLVGLHLPCKVSVYPIVQLVHLPLFVMVRQKGGSRSLVSVQTLLNRV